MILRNVERQPPVASASALGVALAVAILVVGMFFFDAVGLMLDVQFRQIQREDLAVHFVAARGPAAHHDLARLDGVMRVETFRTVPVRFENRHVHRSTASPGSTPTRRSGGSSTRTSDRSSIPAHGVLLNSKLAEILEVRPGDTVRIELAGGSP
jgi:putative ABC transport system permease protein